MVEKLRKLKSIILFLMILILVSPVSFAKSYNKMTRNQLLKEVSSLEKENTEIKEKIILLEKENKELGGKLKEIEKILSEKEKEDQEENKDKEVVAKEKLPVLLYHHILPQEDIDKYKLNSNSSIISLENFKAQMKYLKDNGYKTLTTGEVEKFVKGEMELPEKAVHITFDDGYQSNLKYAYPVMKEYGFKGTVFIIGNGVLKEKEEFDPSRTQRLNLDDAKRHTDILELQCHTNDLHYRDPEVGKTKLELATEKEMIKDLEKNQKLLDANVFAYPHGSSNALIVKSLKSLGYTSAYTVDKEYVTKDMNLYRLPRFSIYQKTDMKTFENIVTGKGI